jgi:hypothetical protein
LVYFWFTIIIKNGKSSQRSQKRELQKNKIQNHQNAAFIGQSQNQWYCG